MLLEGSIQTECVTIKAVDKERSTTLELVRL